MDVNLNRKTLNTYTVKIQNAELPFLFPKLNKSILQLRFPNTYVCLFNKVLNKYSFHYVTVLMTIQICIKTKDIIKMIIIKWLVFVTFVNNILSHWWKEICQTVFLRSEMALSRVFASNMPNHNLNEINLVNES